MYTILKLKTKIILAFLIMCLMLNLQAQTVKEYKIDGSQFIFRGKQLNLGDSFTQSEFEKKFGKCDGWESYPPGETYLVYNNEGLTVFLNTQNKFKGFNFQFDVIKKIALYGVSLNQNDSYVDVRKKLEQKKVPFKVSEDIDSSKNKSIRIEIEYNGYNEITKCVAKIDFSQDGKLKIKNLYYFYEMNNY